MTSPLTLQEAQDIFGDVDEILPFWKQVLREKGLDGVEQINYKGFKIMEEEFKPSVMEEKYLIVKDDKIHETNVM